MKLRTAIIGAGTKGALYPDARLTHAHAFSQDGFQLLGFADVDTKNLTKAKQRWDCIGVETVHEIMTLQPDVVTVAVSDAFHFNVLKAIALQEHKPRLVFTEKPFCQTYAEAKEIAELYKLKGIKLSVNFPRRFLPQFAALKDFKFNRMAGFYTKGIHNLCHLVDLALLLGIENIEPVEVKREDINVFEVVLYGPSGKAILEDHGARIRMVPLKFRDDFPSDRVLDYARESCNPIDLSMAMTLAALNIQDHIWSDFSMDKTTPLISTVENALRVMEVCEQWRK